MVQQCNDNYELKHLDLCQWFSKDEDGHDDNLLDDSDYI